MNDSDRSVSDEALSALKKTHEKLDLDIPFELVAFCYETERDFQFVSESESPERKIKGRVNSYLEQQMNN